MSIQYIKNKRLWNKQQKKISKLMENKILNKIKYSINVCGYALSSQGVEAGGSVVFGLHETLS